jgi:hypothetical protein
VSKRRKPIVLAVIADTHCGSTLGLVPCGLEEGDKQDGTALPEGGRYIPSDGQRWLWSCYLSFLDAADRIHRDVGGDLWALHLGDSREGDHHGTTQLISSDEEVQAYIVAQALDPLRKRVSRWYQVKGTEAHVGPGGDDATGRWARAVRHPDTGQWAAHEWRLNPRKYGCRVHARHHANMGSLPWTKHGAAVRLATQVFAEFAEHAAKTGAPLSYPQLVLRGHQHRFSDSGTSQPVRAIFAPAFQLATSFVHRLSQTTLSDVGGLVIVIYPDGAFDVRPQLYTPALSSEVA